MKIRIAVIADIHAEDKANLDCRGELAENLLLRAVNRANRWILPDIAIIAGDLVADSPSAIEYLAKIKQILSKLTCPYLVVRGNHDPAAEKFYSVFERKDFLDVNGYRFVAFDDRQEKNYCASRTPDQLDRFKQAAANYNGRIIAVQHVPLFPQGMSDCPYNYTNAAQIIAEMERQKVFLSISGHEHKGIELIKSAGVNFISAPALCEKPFSYTIIDVAGENVSANNDCFQMPPELGLIDRHVHTQFAYCGENMDIAKVMNLYGNLGLAGVVFTEHTGQLYFDADSFWKGDCNHKGIAGAEAENCRMARYFELMRQNNVPKESIGLEVDFDYTGKPIITAQDKSQASFFLGSIHHSQKFLRNASMGSSVVNKEFLAQTEAAIKSGVDVLAHPFRMFSKNNVSLQSAVIDKVVGLLKKNKTAAEVNFHTQESAGEFFEKCINTGVKLCLSSDSHNMCELGELWPHLKLLEKLGVSKNDFGRILF